MFNARLDLLNQMLKERLETETDAGEGDETR